MKKMMILVAALLFTACVQAAQVSWTAINVMKDGVKMEKDTYISYFFNSADISLADAIESAKKGSLDISKAINSSTGKGAGVAGAGPTTVEKYVGGANETFYAIIYDSKDITSGKFFTTAEKTVTIKGVGTTAVGFGSQAGAVWTDVVPEPTTFALLALGLVAFGLKRKVA